MTEQGRALCQQAEDATNRCCFAPWACLRVADKIQLHDLLVRLRNDLRRLAESED